MDFEATPDVASATSIRFDTTSTTPESGRSTGTNTPKPALKTASSIDEDDTPTSCLEQKQAASTKQKKKKNRTLKWDEAKIQEHDQLRGTRMKIDEPNTPFAHYDSGSETDCSLSSAKGNNANNHKISWDALTNKLEAHAAVKDQYPSSPSSHGETLGNSSDGGATDEEDEDQKRERQRLEMKRLQFQELRKRHYNEMEVVRRFQRDHPDGVPTLNGHQHSGDTDDDNDGDDENE